MKIQWLGHSAFKLTGRGATILIDPFLTGNPTFKGDLDAVCAGVTHVLITHGHNDHVGDSVAILEKTGARLIATPELTGYLGTQTKSGSMVGMNIGGRAIQPGFSVAMVQAFHSSSYRAPDGRVIYGGMPTGLIVEMDGHRVYHMGDTGVFGDMTLIAEMYRPDIGLVPMGGHYTMDAEGAALAVNRFFEFEIVMPCHYLTFPLLAQSADEFVAKVKKGRVLAPQPMETVEI